MERKLPKLDVHIIWCPIKGRITVPTNREHGHIGHQPFGFSVQYEKVIVEALLSLKVLPFDHQIIAIVFITLLHAFAFLISTRALFRGLYGNRLSLCLVLGLLSLLVGVGRQLIILEIKTMLCD